MQSSNHKLHLSTTLLSLLLKQQLTRSVNTLQLEIFSFFKVVESLLEPVKHKSSTGAADLFGLYHPTDNVQNLIAYSWNDSKKDYNSQIVLRLMQVEIEENVEECLLFNLSVSVNGHSCKLPTINEPKTTNGVPWRFNVPIDITGQIDLRRGFIENILKITWSEDPHEYMADIYAVHKLTVNYLVKELKKNHFVTLI